MFRYLAVGIASCALLACAVSPQTITGDGAASPTVTLPLQSAWHDDQRVFYISTDISDAAMAAMMGSNFAPRLADAVPSVPRPPGERSALERVYKFSDDSQEAVFASVPSPVGPLSRDTAYSPLWQVFWVTWKSAKPLTVLKSEETILAAQERGEVEITRTGIVINCPVVASEAGSLPGVKISLR
jgi:hypothetical protein